MPKADLPGGGWVVFKEPEDILESDVKTILLAGDGVEGSARSYAIRDAQLRVLIVSWSLTDRAGAPLPLPLEKPDVLDQLRPRVVRALINEASYANDELFPPDPDARDENPAGPTVPSDG